MPVSETTAAVTRAMARVPSAFLALLLCGTLEENARAGEDLSGIPWGTPFEQLRDRFDLVLLNSDSACTRYSSNISRIGGVTVAECILEFRGTAFTGAAVLTRGAANTHDFLALLVRLFGPGKKENARACQWLTGTTHAFYDEDSDGDGYMYWYARNLSPGPPPDRPLIRRSPPKQREQR